MTDPFLWLEAETAQTLAWQEAQNRAAAEYLHSTPVWARMLAVARRFAATVLTEHPPVQRGGRWFRERVPAGARRPVVEVADAPTGPGRTLVDLAPAEMPVLYWEPAPDGSRLAYAVTDPPRPTRFAVADVDSGRLLPHGLPESAPGTVHRVAWLPDGERLFVTAIDPARPDQPTAYLVHNGSAERQNVQASRVTVSPDGRWAIAWSSGTPSHRRDLTGSTQWMPFLRNVPGWFHGTVVGDDLVAVTDNGAPRGRLVAIPIDGRAGWRELVPEGTSVLFMVTAVADELILAEHADGATRLRRLALDGTPRGEIPLPEPGMAWPGPGREDGGLVVPAGRGCTFVFSSLTRSPAVYRYELGAPAPRPLTRPRARVRGAALHAMTARGADGTPIPYKLVTTVDNCRPRPTIIGAYGALNIAWLPAYLSGLPAAWAHVGGVYVHAHLRGGGEYGADWWRAARLGTKQTTFDDLYAVATDLVERGWTTPEMLGVVGVSLGALPAAVAVTQRPALVRACVATLPVFDLLRCHRDPVTMADIVGTDLGDPRRPADAAVLRAYSPYHQVRDGVPYPAVLVDCAAADRSCPAWHSRKMVARLQRATCSPHPVLLRVRPAAHGPQTDRNEVVLREAEHLTFLATQLGLVAAAG